MLKKIKKTILKPALIMLILCQMCPNLARGDLNTLIKNVFPSGTMSNATKSAIALEQGAGHLTGGSVVIKTPAVADLQLLSVKAPSCRMGGLPCGAQFEILGGGLSVVSSAELMNHMKGMVQNGMTYAGMLLVETLCPQCKAGMVWLDAKADWVNQMAKLDCESMQKLINGPATKLAADFRAKRQANMIKNGSGKDSAWYAENSKEDNGQSVTTNPEFKSQLDINFNLVYKALTEEAGNRNNAADLNEILMSISGTIIGKKDDQGRPSVVHKKSLLTQDLITDFVGLGGSSSEVKLQLYACDDYEYCLNPKIVEKTINKDAVLFAQLSKIITGLVEKIYNNQGELTSEEEMIIALSSLPLIPKIEMDLGIYANPKNVTLNQADFLEALCFDVAVNYLTRMLHKVEEKVASLAAAQISGGQHFDAFERETKSALRILLDARNRAFKKYDIIAQSKARLAQDQRIFTQKFEVFFSNNQN